MALSTLQIQNVRNIRMAQLEPVSGLNIVEGGNGSGKTSFLEAIFLLGRAKSFRAPSAKRLITDDTPHLIVSGRIHSPSFLTQIGIKKTLQQTEIRINGTTCKKVSELVARFPLQLIRPESHALLEGGPRIRRSFLDWGLFHVKHDYLFAYKRFHRALKQRNMLLKSKRKAGMESWNQELHEYGTIISHAREQYIEQLDEVFQNIVEVFLPDLKLGLSYQVGWDPSCTLSEALQGSLDGDLYRGVTRVGPHRSDVVLLAGKVLAADRLSRGQLKLAVLSLNLAQTAMFGNLSSEQSVILIDDLAAELDRDHLRQVLILLSQMKSQVFITTTDQSVLDTKAMWAEKALFHVKQGEFKRLDSN